MKPQDGRLNRRDLIGTALTAGTASAVAFPLAQGDPTEPESPYSIVDTNLSLSHWRISAT